MDPITSTLIAAGLPVVLELLKGIGGAVSRKLVGLSVDEQVKIWTAEVERLKALAGLDNPGGTPSQWVIDLRGSFRYIAAVVLVVTGSIAIVAGVLMKEAEIVNVGGQVAGFPFGFIFGERMVLALRPASATK